MSSSEPFDFRAKRAELDAVTPRHITIAGERLEIVDCDGLRIVWVEDWYNPETGEYDLETPHEHWEVRYRYIDGNERLYAALQADPQVSAEAWKLEIEALEAEGVA